MSPVAAAPDGAVPRRAGSVLAVTPNPALDVTYDVDRLTPHTTHRVTAVRQRAGGKGVNVGRVLAALGVPVTVLAPVGGATGAAFTADLSASAAGCQSVLVPIGSDIRRTVTAVSIRDGDATVFVEPGPRLTPAEWTGLVAACRAGAATAEVVTISGSLPPGTPPDAFAVLSATARRAGARVVLDTGGAALRAGVAGLPEVVAPNEAELAEATGVDQRPDGGGGRIDAAARVLRAAGAGAVVVTRGPLGLLAVTAEGTWRAVPPRRMRGNPTGAGDAAVAAIARALTLPTRPSWPDILADAAALSAAAVAMPSAGEVDLEAYRALRAAVSVTPL